MVFLIFHVSNILGLYSVQIMCYIMRLCDTFLLVGNSWLGVYNQSFVNCDLMSLTFIPPLHSYSDLSCVHMCQVLVCLANRYYLSFHKCVVCYFGINSKPAKF